MNMMDQNMEFGAHKKVVAKIKENIKSKEKEI